MAQLHYITQAHAEAVGKQGLGLKLTPLQTGCTSASAKSASFFCDYVISLMKQDSTFSAGLEPAEQGRRAEDLHHAEPAGRGRGQAGGELHGAAAAERRPTRAATPSSEVLIQPGTGRILAIANDRPYGTGKNQTTDGLRGGLPVQRRDRRADRFVVQALHPDHRAGAGGAVRLPADRPGVRHADRLHQLRGRSDRPLPAGQRLTVARRARSRCTRQPRSRSTSTSPSWSARSACATWSRRRWPWG